MEVVDAITRPKKSDNSERERKITPVGVLKGHKSTVWSVAWNPKGTIVATTSSDRSIRLWAQSSQQNWICIQVLDGVHTRTVRSVCWSPCGNFLASAGFDGMAAIWSRDAGEWECIATLEGHENEVKCIAWSQSGGLIATCSRDKSVWIWEAEGEDDYACLSVLQGHKQDVKFVVWHPREMVLFSCSYDNSIKLWAEDETDDDWSCIQSLHQHTSTVWYCAFDPNSKGNRMVSCSDDCTIIVWEAGEKPQGALISSYVPKTLTTVGKRTLYSVDWSIQGNIIVASRDNSLRVYGSCPTIKMEIEDDEKKDGKHPSLPLIAEYPNAHKQDLNAVRFNPKDPTLVCTGSDDFTAKLWRLGVECKESKR
ncbi:hypothetical protein AAMO2058_000438900 [Amorphochlora amoebiformis]|uniref:Probable cytosolic iron-sulfur protein assembly protein CIAO1 homolog n=1 Tax=Amorphochlora amoebiformis TaxID=1561963 RepID=A0A7S0CZ39_9EUKA